MKTTGATDEQIEAAAIAEWGKSSLTDPNTVKVVTKYARMLVPPDHRIVGVDDLRAQRNGLIQFREHYADIVASNQVMQREGDCTLEEIDKWKQNGRDGWGRKYPESADAIDRIQAAIGEAE